MDAASPAARAVFLARAEALSKRRTAAATALSSAHWSGRWAISPWRARDARCASSGPRLRPSGRPWGSIEAELFISPNPGEELRPSPASSRAGSYPESCWRSRPSRRPTHLARRSSSTRSTPGSAGQWRTWWEDGCSGWRMDSRCSASPTCLRSPRTGRRTSTSASPCVRDGRSTSVTRLGATEREEEVARMIAGNVVTPAVRASAAEMLKARQAGAKGEYKSKGESERPRGRRA